LFGKETRDTLHGQYRDVYRFYHEPKKSAFPVSVMPFAENRELSTDLWPVFIPASSLG
jgi:hypothetical protein